MGHFPEDKQLACARAAILEDVGRETNKKGGVVEEKPRFKRPMRALGHSSAPQFATTTGFYVLGLPITQLPRHSCHLIDVHTYEEGPGGYRKRNKKSLLGLPSDAVTVYLREHRTC